MSALDSALDVRRPRSGRLSAPASQLLLIANANASGLAGRRDLVRAVERELRISGARVETRVTAAVDDLASVLAGHPARRIVLLGGDGSVHSVADLPGPRREVALLPIGRANNVARSLGIPTDLRAAVELAVHGRARALDLIAAESAERRYLAVEGVSVGFLALARARYRATNSADVVHAVTAGLGALARFRPFVVALASDGEVELARVGQLFVANLPLYGFGLRVAPGANPADGRLDLVALPLAGRRSVPALLRRLRQGAHLGRPGVRSWQARRVRIATGGCSPVIADSTDLGSGPVDLSVQRAALRLVAPEP